MTAPSPRPKRHWLWAATALVFIALTVLAMRLVDQSKNDALVKKAAAITLGMTQTEVRQVLGTPSLMYNAGKATGLCYGESSRRPPGMLGDLYLRFGLNKYFEQMLSFDDWPVHIQFGTDGFVSRLKRGTGSEAKIEKPND